MIKKNYFALGWRIIVDEINKKEPRIYSQFLFVDLFMI